MLTEQTNAHENIGGVKKRTCSASTVIHVLGLGLIQTGIIPNTITCDLRN